MTPIRVLIAGGGTGGHVFPALAIGNALTEGPGGAELLFLGTSRGLESRLVPQAGYPLELIEVGQLKNVSLATRARTLFDLPRSVLEAGALIKRFRPDVVVGVGGYASGPAMAAAVLRRVPTLAFEPNAAPGLANRLVGRYVSAAAVNFAPATRYFRNAQVTGIPVREAFFHTPPMQHGPAQRLLIFGGSQGARALNRAMPQILVPLLSALPQLTVLHQAGARMAEETEAAFVATGADPSRWSVRPFLDDMAAQFAEADLVLCRSGASTVAELCAAGRPSLLIPFPQAADDHQRRNAEVLAAGGAAAMLIEAELTPERLLAQVTSLLSAPAALAEMAQKARAMAHRDARETIAGMVRSLASRRVGASHRVSDQA